MKLQVVGQAFNEMCEDPELTETPFSILDLERMKQADTKGTFIPDSQPILSQLLAAQPPRRA